VATVARRINMVSLVDTSRFQLGPEEGLEGADLADELSKLAASEAAVREYVTSRTWTQPTKDVLLAYGVGDILGLYLVRFQEPLPDGDPERWFVVGDLPRMNFETEDATTPALALELYCAIAQDWADRVLADDDLSDSYPIEAPPTKGNADDLLGRIEFIRDRLVPLAKKHGAAQEAAGRDQPSHS
jgi:hypothetical protein